MQFDVSEAVIRAMQSCCDDGPQTELRLVAAMRFLQMHGQQAWHTPPEYQFWNEAGLVLGDEDFLPYDASESTSVPSKR